MKLPHADLDLATALLEFDIWITPSTGEIRDTDRFRDEMQRVTHLFDVMGDAIGEFSNEKHCDPVKIADTIIEVVDKLESDDATVTLESLASVLFLVTGNGGLRPQPGPQSQITRAGRFAAHPNRCRNWYGKSQRQ
jgi:hypothetical protein